MQKDALKTFEKTILYIKESVTLSGSCDRQTYNNENLNLRIDADLADRINKLEDVINKQEVYRIPLRFFVYLGLVLFDSKIFCTLETDMSNLFETNAKSAAISQPDAKIIWNDAPFIQFEQNRLNDNFRQYLELSLISKTFF